MLVENRLVTRDTSPSLRDMKNITVAKKSPRKPVKIIKDKDLRVNWNFCFLKLKNIKRIATRKNSRSSFRITMSMLLTTTLKITEFSPQRIDAKTERYTPLLMETLQRFK